jgi:hypothetical protein
MGCGLFVARKAVAITTDDNTNMLPEPNRDSGG